MAKVFFVEDEHILANELKDFLEGDKEYVKRLLADENIGGGYHSVSQADRGSQAIQMLQDFTPETKPDFIILDNNFPAGAHGEVDMKNPKYAEILNEGAGLVIAKMIREGIFPNVDKDVPIIGYTYNSYKQTYQLKAKEVGITRAIGKNAEEAIKIINDISQQKKGGFEVK